MSIKCNNTECKHHSEGGCWPDGQLELTVIGELGTLLCQNFEYNGEELYGWDTSIVDDVVRLYEGNKTSYDVVLSDDYEEPTKSRPFWTYGLEDGGYLRVIPTTYSSVRLDQYLDDQLVRSVVYRDFEGFLNIFELQER